MFKRFLISVVLVGLLPVTAAGAAEGDEFGILFPQEAVVTHFTDSWGAARSGHRHQGNDLMAPKMTEVYAVADGTVSWIRDRGTAGRYVVIDHGDGWESWSMHLNNDTPGTDDGRAPMALGVVVSEGDKVVAGQLIGYVGDSGNAEGSSPHTHFELHFNGSAIDPHSYLVAAYSDAVVAERLKPLAARLRIR